MQTTLRIDDALYREAKAEAARQGQTLTRFIEEGLRLRLEAAPAPQAYSFRVYDRGGPVALSDADIRRIAEEDQEKHDLAKLGVSRTS